MPAKIVAVFNQKGGCAKTMTTMQVGGACALFGKRTLIIDMDPQSTSSIWSSQAKVDSPFPASVISLAPHREKMINELSKFVDIYDLIMIDCPPAIDSPTPWAALQVADVGLIPAIPVMDNIWACKEARELGMRAKRENKALQLYYLASRVQRGNLFEMCKAELAKDADVPLMKACLNTRNAYPESQLFGTTVHALDKKSPASKEVDAVAHELLTILGIK